MILNKCEWLSAILFMEHRKCYFFHSSWFTRFENDVSGMRLDNAMKWNFTLTLTVLVKNIFPAVLLTSVTCFGFVLSCFYWYKLIYECERNILTMSSFLTEFRFCILLFLCFGVISRGYGYFSLFKLFFSVSLLWKPTLVQYFNCKNHLVKPLSTSSLSTITFSRISTDNDIFSDSQVLKYSTFNLGVSRIGQSFLI